MGNKGRTPLFDPPPPQPAGPFVLSLVQAEDGYAQVLSGGMSDLDLAVKAALLHNIPQMIAWKITSGTNFLEFAQGMLSWVPSENVQGKEIYWVLCLFYFILDQPPIQAQQTPISPSSIVDGKPTMTALSTWIVQFAQQMGSYMSGTSSLTAASFESFELSPSFNLSEADLDFSKPTGGLQCFNDLFSRHLKTGTRPIWQPADDTQIVFPADSTFDDWFNVDSDSIVTIKNVQWKISDLLVGSQYASEFAGGVWMHAFLGPSDYHCQHAPVGGTVIEAFTIPGLAYLNVVAVDQGDGTKDLIAVRAMDAPDDPGYEFMQLRGCIVIQNDTVGLVAVLPIGMAQVSSVNVTVKPQQTVNKGDMISNFAFGGSDIVVVFQQQANVTFNATPSRNGPNNEPDYYPGEHGQVGHLLATASPRAYKKG
jgi:phosphatidylserine decarboxylase